MGGTGDHFCFYAAGAVHATSSGLPGLRRDTSPAGFNDPVFHDAGFATAWHGGRRAACSRYYDWSRKLHLPLRRSGLWLWFIAGVAGLAVFIERIVVLVDLTGLVPVRLLQAFGKMF